MKTIALIVSASVLISLNAEGAWRKSHQQGSPVTRSANGTFYLSGRAPVPVASAVPVATNEKKGLFGGLFKKKAPPVANPSVENRASVEVRRPKVLALPSPTPVRATVPETREKKPGLFARLFGTKKRSAPVHRGPNATQEPIMYYSDMLGKSNRSNTKVVIDVHKQRAFLLVNGRVGMDTPISTARPGKNTPRGTHYMGERVRSGKVSTIYHVGMPFWMRLGGSLYGVHAGYLPGYPASAGCIRLPMEAAQVVYDNTRSGTVVSIQSSWGGYAAAMGQVGDSGYRMAGL
jgi:lipoprotein-anchoring transpeptidase ErfK/SrfK